MAKNILIFSDGTGQGASMPAEERTNVWKLWNATKDAAPSAQVAFYDPGLGSAEEKKDNGWLRWGQDLVSQATGLGISRNIKDCYDALIEGYQPGDRIFLFGFSRGAYTVRSLGGVLSLCGVPQHDAAGKTVGDKAVREPLVEEAIETVYKHYGNDDATKAERKRLGREFRAKYGGNIAGTQDPPVPYFIGVWDTVRALGIPGSSGLVGWRHAFHDATLNSRVPYARHALSIDENRKAFEPELWDETPQDRATGRIKQVWFPGVHSDVGGGYPESGLSDLALDWMTQEVLAIPDSIAVDVTRLNLNPSYEGTQHNERTGKGFVWIEGTREGKVPDVLHEAHVGQRFGLPKARSVTGEAANRPRALSAHPVYRHLYSGVG
jgi:uncharacterized protein (DUF2235 family)